MGWREQPRRKGRFETKRKIEWKNNVVAGAKQRKLASDVNKVEVPADERTRTRTHTMDISSMLEVQVKEETDIKENVTPGKDQASSATSTATTSISQDESNFYKLMFGNDIAAVRFRRIHCTACDAHIGSAPAQIHNMFEHPVLRTLLCANCRDFYGDGTFEQGDDATDMFCRWCANGGNLYCCSYCSNTFCYKCIRRNFTSLVRKKIEADEKWKCFVCNPSGLYSARAICWALLQHVQTVTRILAHDKKMSAHEVEEKMNLDESPCCPRRNKRKRRRLESNSEEEDETYSPVKANGMSQPGQIKRKQLKKHKPTVQPAYNTTNGTREVRPFIMPIPIRPRPASFLSGQSFKQPEPSQSAVSHKNVLVNPSKIVLPSSSMIKSNTSLPSRFDPETLQQQPSLYHTSFMSTSGSTAYIQTPVTMNPTRIILPSHPQSQLTSYQPQQASSYQSLQPLQSSPNTMVSIPNSVDKRGRSLFLLPKSKESGVTLTPNIIELDSDSDDELRVVEQQNNAIDEGNNLDVNAFSNKVVPVALTWENSDDDCMREEQPLRETLATFEKDISLSEMMLPHSRELDKLFSDAKVKVYDFFDLNNAIENIEVEAQQRLKHFYCNMRDTVFQLVHINDRITRQYVEWRRSRKMETEASSSINENALVSQENIATPLDMTCVNDSDTESKDEDEGYRIMEPSDLIKDSNIVKDLFYKKKNVVHRGVGDDSVHLSVDKATQVYDVISKDYEESIGYFMCTKTDHDPKMNYSVSDLPTTSNKNSSKYEDQFIFYLQNIENNDIDTEDTKSLVDSDETPLQEVIQTDISCLIQDIDLPVVSTDQSKNCQEEKDLSDNINSVTENDTLNKNNKEIVSNSDTKIQETNMELDKLQETESRETHTDTTNEKAILIMSDNNEVNSNKNGNLINTEVAASTVTEEDCTIIDD